MRGQIAARVSQPLASVPNYSVAAIRKAVNIPNVLQSFVADAVVIAVYPVMAV
jgi:hypothetical protein